MGVTNVKEGHQSIAHQDDLLGACWNHYVEESEDGTRYVPSRWMAVSKLVMTLRTGHRCFAIRGHRKDDAAAPERRDADGSSFASRSVVGNGFFYGVASPQHADPGPMRNFTGGYPTSPTTPFAPGSPVFGPRQRRFSNNSFSYPYGSSREVSGGPLSSSAPLPNFGTTHHAIPPPAAAQLPDQQPYVHRFLSKPKRGRRHVAKGALIELREAQEDERGAHFHRHPYLQVNGLSVLHGVLFRGAPARRRYDRIAVVECSHPGHEEEDEGAESAPMSPLDAGPSSTLAWPGGTQGEGTFPVVHVRSKSAPAVARESPVEVVSSSPAGGERGAKGTGTAPTVPLSRPLHKGYPIIDQDDLSVKATTPPIVIGSITVEELQVMPTNAEICIGGWLYMSLQDEQRRLRLALDAYQERRRKEQQEALRKVTRPKRATVGATAELTDEGGALSGAPSPMKTGRMLNCALMSDGEWMPYAYLIVALPMYECSLSPTGFHLQRGGSKPISMDLADSQSRKAFGVGCVTSVRYGGMLVIECRDRITESDAPWLSRLIAMGDVVSVAGNSGHVASPTAVGRYYLRSRNLMLLHRRHSTQQTRSLALPLTAKGKATELSTAASHPAPGDDARQRRSEDMYRIKRRLYRQLRRQGMYVVEAFTRVAARKAMAHKLARRAVQGAVPLEHILLPLEGDVTDFGHDSEASEAEDDHDEAQEEKVKKGKGGRVLQGQVQPLPAMVKGTFRQIGGIRFIDTESLMQGCTVKEIVIGIQRWIHNLLCQPIKARPLSLYLQRYEGIANALRIGGTHTHDDEMEAALHNSFCMGKQSGMMSMTSSPCTGLQGGTSYYLVPTSAAADNMPFNSSFGGRATQAGAPALIAGQAGPYMTTGGVYPTLISYSGPLDPGVRAVLAPEEAALIASSLAVNNGWPRTKLLSPNGLPKGISPNHRPVGAGRGGSVPITPVIVPSTKVVAVKETLRSPTAEAAAVVLGESPQPEGEQRPRLQRPPRLLTPITSSHFSLTGAGDADLARRELLSLRSELDELRMLLVHARSELHERTDQFVRLAALLLPHTPVDQVTPTVVFLKTLRQHPNDVPVKELHADWLPSLVTLLTIPDGELFYTGKDGAVSECRGHGQVHRLLLPSRHYGSVDDMCDTNRPPSQTRGPGSTPYTLEPVKRQGQLSPLRELSISMPFNHLQHTPEMRLNLMGTQAGHYETPWPEGTLSGCFTGGSLGTLAGLLQYYAALLLEKKKSTRTAGKTPPAQGLEEDSNVLLRRLRVCGAVHGKFRSIDEMREYYAEKSAKAGCGLLCGSSSLCKWKPEKRMNGSDHAAGQAMAHSFVSNEKRSMHRLAFSSAEAFALFDAIAYYLRVVRDMKQNEGPSHTETCAGRAAGRHSIIHPRSLFTLMQQSAARLSDDATPPGVMEAAAPPAAGVAPAPPFVSDFELCIASDYYYCKATTVRPTVGAGTLPKGSTDAGKESRRSKNKTTMRPSRSVRGNHVRDAKHPVPPNEAEAVYCGGEEAPDQQRRERECRDVYHFLQAQLTKWAADRGGSVNCRLFAKSIKVVMD